MGPLDMATHQISAVDEKSAVQTLSQGFSTEVTPASAAKVTNFGELLPRGTKVYITFLPGSDYRDTVSLAKRLRGEGFEPVPHFAARSISDQASFADYLARCRGEADVTQVLAIAGAPDKPCGAYADTMQLLSTGLFEKHGITSVSVAGHPEGCSCHANAVLLSALKQKAEYAKAAGLQMQVVTQFCFEAEPVIAYDNMLKREGIELPLVVGLAGVATIKTLLGYAMSCGVGNSINFLKKQAMNVTKLLSAEAPDKVLRATAAHRANDLASRVAGLHYFPLGGLRKTATWANAVAGGKFALDGNGGLQVAA